MLRTYRRQPVVIQYLCNQLADKFPRALGYGLNVVEIKRLLNYAITYLADQYDYQLHWSRPFHQQEFNSVELFWNCIGEQIADARTTVIICLAQPLYHWTVAQQVTTQTVKCFDSAGFGRYRLTSFTLDETQAGDRPGQKIRLNTRQSFLLRRG